MADFVYNNYKEQLFNGGIDLANDTIKLALLDNGHTPDQDLHDNWDDVSADEISGTGYTTGGETLGTKSVSQDNTDNEGVFDAADVQWTSASFTARYGVIYKDSGTPSTSPLIALLDFGSDQTVASGTFTVSWNAEGILNAT